MVAEGINPSSARKAAKAAHANLVELIAEEWLSSRTDITAGTLAKSRRRLEMYLFSQIGKRPIASVKPADLLAVLKRIKAAHTAKRVNQLCSSIWRYGIATNRCEHDITADIRGALPPTVTEHHASLVEPKRVGDLMKDIGSYKGQVTTQCALRLAPLTFVRPGELRKAEWAEFDLDAEHPVWRIPAAKMKMRDAHVVPLSLQAVAVIREIEAHTSGGKYLFPSLRSGARPMSDNTVNAALRRLNYSGDEMVGHGFRSTASTMLNELEFHPDLIELQLAHKERNKSRASYNKALRLVERRQMMQAWADYLEALRDGGNVVAIGARISA